MKFLKIQNKGVLDARLIALMGGTTKRDDPNLIGEFGSGLKYTLAYLLRNNLVFHLFTGTKEIKFSTKQEIIRDTKFDIIYIDGEKTSITSNMGMDWKAWMIIRELYANSMDEGGSKVEEVEEIGGENDTTTFYVQIDKEIREVMDNWNTYFLPKDVEPLTTNFRGSIHKGSGCLRLYKQGILVYEDLKQPSLFNYDVKNIEINELREFRGNPSYDISYILKNCTCENTIKKFLDLVKEEHFEGDMMWPSWENFSKTWGEVVEHGSIVSKEIVKKMMDLGKSIPANLIIVPNNVFTAIAEELPYLSAVTITKGSGAFYDDYNEQTEKKIKEALTILEACDYYIHEDLEFRYGLFENRNVQAQVKIKDKVVLISNSLIQKPLSTVVSILIEENEHYMTGFEDESRAFQQHFIDLYARQLLKTHEIEI